MYADFEKIIKEKGLRVSDVSRGTGIKQGVFSDWKAGRYTPKADKMTAIAEFLEVPVETIASKTPGTYTQIVSSLKKYGNAKEVLGEGKNGVVFSFRIPVLGRVAAGLPIEAQQEILDFEEITAEMAFSGEYFGLQIQGDSMEPRMRNGDVVIVKRQETADNNDVVIALVNGNDAVCKRLKVYNEGIALVSNNPAYDPMYFSKEEIESTPVRILGIVKELRGKSF